HGGCPCERGDVGGRAPRGAARRRRRPQRGRSRGLARPDRPAAPAREAGRIVQDRATPLHAGGQASGLTPASVSPPVPSLSFEILRTMSSTISFGLEGRIAVITGASNGIGAACARRLAQDGAHIALWDVADDAGRALAAELTAGGAKALYVHCNVAARAEVEAAVAATISA